MPKYVPDPEDLYDTSPCFICGDDVLDEGAKTCSDECAAQKQSYDEDYEFFLMEESEWDMYP